MIKKIVVVILMAALAVGIGRGEELVKGKLYYFSYTGIVAQKIKEGVLLWSRDDVANKRTWRDANDLIFLKLKDTSGFKKGMEFGSGMWMKYTGTYRHGNRFVGYRDISAYALPNKEEVEQALYEEKLKKEQEHLKQLEEERQRDIERRKALEQEQLKQREEERQREMERRKALEQSRFEEEQKRIKEQAEQEKIERELQRQREENNRKLAAERAKAAIEAERQRQEDARKAEEERQRRYPIEQKERSEYTQEMLSKISFDIGSYFDIQKDLKRYIYSASVTEKKWAQLKELQAKCDWLGMLKAISETDMKDFPEQTQIAAIIESLKATIFHAEFLFTHKMAYNDSISIGYVDLHENNNGFERWDMYGHGHMRISSDKDGIIVSFSMAECKVNKPLLYADYSNPSKGKLFHNRWTQLHKIESDLELGKITRGDADGQREAVEEKFRRELVAWVETSKVQDRTFTKKVREGRANIDIGKSDVGNKSGTSSKPTKPQWVTCPECNGSRYISKGRCYKCDGVGKYRTRVTQGIGGHTMGGRMTQCDMCNGKGEIRKTCKTCHGRGKVKQ